MISRNVGVSVFPVGFHERRVGGPLLPYESVFKWADLRAYKQLCEFYRVLELSDHNPFVSFRNLEIVTLGETFELLGVALAFETKESQVVLLILQD